MRGAFSDIDLTGRLGTLDADALAAVTEAAASLVQGAPLAEALEAIARAAAEATGADLALVRSDDETTGSLVLRAVITASAVLAAEVQGSRLRVDEVGTEELLYETDGDGSVPAAVRRTAARVGASIGLVLPVLDARGVVRATLELYVSEARLDPHMRSLARLAAVHVGLALELDEALAEAGAGAERGRLPLEAAGEALAAGSDEAELAEHVVRVAADATGAARCLLWRIEPEAPPAFLAAHGFDGAPPELGEAAQAVAAALDQRGVRLDENGLAALATEQLVVPLGEPAAGALQLEWDGPALVRDPGFLAGFAARVGLALRRTRRAHLVALALRRSQTIVAVVSQAIARLSLSHTLETAVERISELTASAHVAIYLRERDRLVDAASRGMRGNHPDLAERLLELALGPFRGRGFLFIPDLRRDSRLVGLQPVLEETGVRRALVIPLVVRDEVIGALAVYKQRPRPYREGEEGMLIALSSQLAVAVQNARLHERTKELGAVLERTLASERRAAHQLRGLFEISHAFTRSLSLEATLEAIARAMVEVFGVDAAAIRMPDERRQELEARAVHVADAALREAATAMLARPQPLTDPLVVRVLSLGEPLILSSADPEGEGDRVLEPFLRRGSTAVVLPLATPAESIGTLTLLSLDPARPLDADTVETAMTVAAQASLAIENARLYQQQKYFAETMQRSLLPTEIPAVPGVEIGHVYQSSARVDVGGDVYDFLSLDDGRVAIVLGDVIGKGIQAAADMAMAKFSFRALARSYPSPSEFLARTNDVVIEEIALGKFITMVYAVIDPRTREVCCASAGHPPIRVVRPDGSIESLAPSGLALGIDAGQTYEEERVVLDPGSAILLYTDGVIEARREGELYGEARLDEFLAANVSLSAQELAEAVLADSRAFSGGDLADDCAVVCLRTGSVQAP